MVSRDPAGSGEESFGWTHSKGAGKTSSEVGTDRREARCAQARWRETETPREAARASLSTL